MNERVLLARIDGDAIDMKTGRFPMVLATDGEASDGDILSIEGAQWADQAPLQNAHMNEAKSTLGSVTRFRRDLTGTPKKLRAEGQIEMDGEGSQAEIRRDIAFMVGRGHIRGVSVRWSPVEWVRRTNLPEDHPAYVNAETEKDPWKRYGLFFKKWRVLEGSIAPVQADPASMIGRAEETEGAVAEFWRKAASDIESRRKALETAAPDPSDFDEEFEYMRAALSCARGVCNSDEQAEALCRAVWSESRKARTDEPDTKPEVAEAKPEVAEPSPESRKAAFAAYLRELSEQGGLTLEELAEVMEEQRKSREPTVADLVALVAAQQQEIEAMRQQVASLEQSRVHGEPAPPIRTVIEAVDRLESILDEKTRLTIAAADALIDKRTGKIPANQKSHRELLREDVDAVIREAMPESQGDVVDPALVSSLSERLDSMIVQRARERAEARRAAQEN